LVSISSKEFGNATQRNGNALHRNSADTPPALAANAKKYNTVLHACRTPALRRWLPQALALTNFFATFFVETGNACSELRCARNPRNDGNHA